METCRAASQLEVTATPSPTSTRVGDRMLNASQSSGRRHTQSTRLMTTRGASVTIGEAEKVHVHKQQTMAMMIVGTVTTTTMAMTATMTTEMTATTTTEMTVTMEIVTAMMTSLTSPTLLRSSRQSGLIHTTRKIHHQGPCSKSIAHLITSKGNLRKSMPSSRPKI